jgi:hypothetical protein
MRNLWLLFLMSGMLFLDSFAQVGINTDNSAPNASAILDVKSTTLGFLPPRMTSSQRDAIASPAEGLTVYCTDCTPKGIYYFNGTGWVSVSSSSPGHYVGELFGGGIVLWLDNTGEHGFITSLIDLSQGSVWSNIANLLVGTGAESYWNGTGNSAAIIAQPGHTTSAAKICDDYTNASYGTGIYSDWYLPAIDQLGRIYHERYILNKNIDGVTGADLFENTYYWSSTEAYSLGAWELNTFTGEVYSIYKSDQSWVRCFRDF